MSRERWLTIGLVASVAMNLAIGGLVIGHIVRGPMPWRPGDPEGGPAHRLMRMMPADARGFVRQSFDVARPVIKDRAAALRKSREGVREAIMAEPFDRVRLDQAFAEMRRRSDELQQAVQGAIGDGIAKMPADIRQKVGHLRPPEGAPEDGPDGPPPGPPPDSPPPN